MQPATTSLVEFELATAGASTLSFGQLTASLPMRIPSKIGIFSVLVFLALGWAAFTFLTRMDRVTTTYTTRAEAQADRLFDRGWLPSLIPMSATDIRVTNDLDTNLSEGSFSFDPADSKAFTGSLSPVDRASAVASHPFGRIASSVTPYTFSDGDGQWTFFVSSEKGRCDYVLEPRY